MVEVIELPQQRDQLPLPEWALDARTESQRRVLLLQVLHPLVLNS